MMNNPMMMIMQMMNNPQGFNPTQILSMFGGNPLFQQAQKMMQSGNDPKVMIQNIAQQKGISTEQLQELANKFNIKL